MVDENNTDNMGVADWVALVELHKWWVSITVTLRVMGCEEL